MTTVSVPDHNEFDSIAHRHSWCNHIFEKVQNLSSIYKLFVRVCVYANLFNLDNMVPEHSEPCFE